MRIYVGNLSYGTDEPTLRGAFEAYGDVEEASIITDRDTGRPRGFAFVTMANREQAQEAIEGLNGSVLDGRTLTVNEARPRGGGGGGGGGGRRGGGGRDRW